MRRLQGALASLTVAVVNCQTMSSTQEFSPTSGHASVSCQNPSGSMSALEFNNNQRYPFQRLYRIIPRTDGVDLRWQAGSVPNRSTARYRDVPAADNACARTTESLSCGSEGGGAAKRVAEASAQARLLL